MFNNGRPRVLIAEDESELRDYLRTALTCNGYEVETADDGDTALEMLENQSPFSVVLLDLVMPRLDGLRTLGQMREFDPNLPVIMFSGVSSPGKVVRCIRAGATDFVEKPLTHDRLIEAIRSALSESKPSPGDAASHTPQQPLAYFGNSPATRELRSLIEQIGSSEVPVLIQGETGVGKEVIARELHARSPRAQRPFLKLNCAALPDELVESELFGFERGAFTGAQHRKIGMFELAHTGTILLDEIGDMDLRLQAKLLQVLQDHEFSRLGSKDLIEVDVRVLAATHRDLQKAIAEGRFREDVFYRLNVITVNVPALRDRREDIIPIADFLIRRHWAGFGTLPVITPQLADRLVRYNWPGNVRELENVVRRFVALGDADTIIRDLDDKLCQSPLDRAAHGLSPVRDISLPPASPAQWSHSLKDVSRAMHDAEVDAILSALNRTKWNRKEAAKLLNVDYKALLYKIKKLAIEDRTASV